MAKNKISQYDTTAANNTDVANINIAEGCSPSNVNNAIRAVMGHLKDFQSGTSNDSLTLNGDLAITGGFTVDGAAGTTGQVLVSAGTGATPTWGNAFVAGMIMMWSGTVATIPAGWYLCDGTNSTPDLTNKFIVGADADDGGTAKTTITGSATQTGGDKDAIIPSHTHTTTGNYRNNFLARVEMTTSANGSSTDIAEDGTISSWITSGRNDGGSRAMRFQNEGFNETALSLSTTTTGESADNANLPPYYALAFIMKG